VKELAQAAEEFGGGEFTSTTNRGRLKDRRTPVDVGLNETREKPLASYVSAPKRN
jgi:hypothetical protein